MEEGERKWTKKRDRFRNGEKGKGGDFQSLALKYVFPPK